MCAHKQFENMSKKLEPIDKTSNLSVHQIWSRGGAPHRRSVVMVRPVFYAPAPTVYTEEKGRGVAALWVVVCSY